MRDVKGQFVKGHKHSKEIRRKISKSSVGKPPTFGMLGKKASVETRKKLSESHKGKYPSQETRKKLSESHKGKIGYWKGKKREPFTEIHRTKMSEAKSGKRNPTWKGGITKINDIVRSSLENKIWRKRVLERDKKICQKYGIKVYGKRAHVHHIKNFAQYPELRFKVDNGVTLSKKAHREFHKKYGIKNNTREQLIEFLKK